MVIMIRVSKTIDGNWEVRTGTHAHNYIYNATPIRRRFDARAGVNGGSVGRVWAPSHGAPAVAQMPR